jgi:hypothetical protein
LTSIPVTAVPTKGSGKRPHNKRHHHRNNNKKKYRGATKNMKYIQNGNIATNNYFLNLPVEQKQI